MSFFVIFWIILGSAFLIFELLTTTFFVLFFGLGAISLGVLLLFLTFTSYSQVGIFLLFSLLYLLIFRKWLKRRKYKKQAFEFYEDVLVGEIGITQSELSPTSLGKVLIRDTHWSATSTVQIDSGKAVKVIKKTNLTLEVLPL